ncbi:MAG: FitA-like ribbon-helix-helix domain-containing protein [Tepidiformaceae bacterium]
MRNIRTETDAYLRRQAAAHGHSLQAEIRHLLDGIEETARQREADSWEAALAWQKRLGGSPHSDSAQLTREDRDPTMGGNEPRVNWRAGPLRDIVVISAAGGGP